MWVARVVRIIPTVRNRTTEGQAVVDLFGCDDAGMGEWFAVLEGVRQQGEEVIGCANHVVADRRVEAANLRVPAVVAELEIGLGNAQTVERSVAPMRFEAS